MDHPLELTHVYPLGPATDLAHAATPVPIDRPMPRCWLCQEGICTQSLTEPGIVVHGTWAGH